MTHALLCLSLALPMSLGASAALAQSPEPDPVLDQQLVLSEMAGTPVAPDAGITATFASDGSLSGLGGCNSYSAAWQSDGTSLTIGPIAATLKACDEATDALESQYFRILQDAATSSLDGSALTIAAADGTTLVYGGDAPVPALVGAWQLSTFGGTAVPRGTVATAIFGADGSLTGSGGCNTYSGTYTTDGASLSISPLAATRLFCADTGEIEPAYLDALQAATGWAVDGGTLTISSTVDLVFGNGSAPTGTLTGQPWSLVTQGGETVDPTLGISATFADDGTVSGSGGCNQYNATYTVDGDTIAIGPIAATRMACAPHIGDAEAAYFTALESAMGFVVGGADLIIATADGSTLEFQVQGGPPPSSAPTAEPSAASSPAATGSIFGAWQMTEFAGQALPGGVLDISIAFADDGTFSGNGGCSDYAGTYTLSGSTIAFKDFVPPVADSGCNVTAKSLQESFFSLVPFLDTAEVTDGTLSILSALAGGTGFTFEPAQ